MKHPELRLNRYSEFDAPQGVVMVYDTPQGVVMVYFKSPTLMVLLWEVKKDYWQPEPWDGWVTRKIEYTSMGDTAFPRDYPVYRMLCEKVPLPPKRNPFYPEEQQ